MDINIISETPQVTYPTPGNPVVVIALTYQIDTGIPRTIWIEESKLPDKVFLRTHPEAKEAPAELVRQGDDARKAAIRADIEKRKAAPTTRKLSV